MLLLSNERTITVDGWPLLPDHRDENLWVFVGTVAEPARRGPDQSAQFTLVYYKAGAVTGACQGRCCLMFETRASPRQVHRAKDSVTAPPPSPRSRV